MKMRWVIALVLGILAAPAYAMRCGDHLIDKGDVNAEVVARCGAPYVINTYVVYEVIDHPFHYKTGHARARRPTAVVLPVHVEEWIYNFGPSRFLLHVRFIGGYATDVRAGEYGF